MKVPRTRPLIRYWIRPACSTTYSRLGSAGVDAIAVSAPRPLAYGWSESWCCCGASSAAAARSVATISAKVPAAEPIGSHLYLLLKQDLAQFVFLAGLEDREHLVTRLQLGRADRDLGLAVAHDGDQPRSLRQPQLLHRLARARRALVDLHLDDLEVLLAQLEQMDEIVLR